MKRWFSRGISALLVGTMIVALLPHGWQSGSITTAAEQPEKIVRGVINSLEELPQYNNEENKAAERGTAERPFTILEIVPYEEMAEFGYLIGGCEPVKVEEMFGRGDLSTVKSLGDADKNAGTNCFFFLEEPEGRSEMYDNNPQPYATGQSYKGYYEVVEDGTGYFSYTLQQPDTEDDTETEDSTETEETESTGKKESTEKEDDTESTEGTEQKDNTENTGDTEKKDNTESTGSTEQKDNTESTESTEQKDNTESTRDTEKKDSTENTGDTEKKDNTENTGDTEKKDSTENTGDTEKKDNTESTGGTEKKDNTENTGDDTEQKDNTENTGDTEQKDSTEQQSSIGNTEGTEQQDNTETSKTTENTENSGKTDDIQKTEQADAESIQDNQEADVIPKDTDIVKSADLAPVIEKNTKIKNDENINTEYVQHIKEKRSSAVGTELTITRQDGGNLIWHTLTPFEEEYNSGSELFDVPDQKLASIGDRYYTYRKSTEEDKTIQGYYLPYKNRELFLTDTLALSEDAAANYSIVIKTITPEELNKTPEWVDYADLVYLSPKSHVGGLPKVWQKYNRLGKKSSVDVNSMQTGFGDSKDISWEVALRLYNKITADEDYAAIVIDDGVYNMIPQSKNVKIDVRDWNMESSGLTYDTTGSCNNAYKLCVMLLCMDSKLFHSLYLNEENPVIQDGVDTLQTGDAANYWEAGTFLLVPPEAEREPYVGPYQLWTKSTDGSGVPDVWKKYGMCCNLTTENLKYWTKNHVYTYKGDNSISMDYDKDGSINRWGHSDYFTDFKDYLEDIGANGNQNSSDAVRYILGIHKKDNNPDDKPKQKAILKILDLEPCVGLSKTADDGTEYIKDGKIYSEPKWVLKENYIRMLFPAFTGTIEITHQTTAEFNGKVEDLNSTYDMIYLGVDTGAYNLTQRSVCLGLGTGANSWRNLNLPDWNDDSMDGKIYFHTGDKMYSTEKEKTERTASVKFLYDVAAGTNVNDTELRFGGNDISKLKIKELQEYVDAGYPIVAATYLYNLEDALIDNSSNIYQFVRDNKDGSGGKVKGVYSLSQTAEIEQSVTQAQDVVTFTELPALYNGETQGTVITNPNYLPMNGGKSCLPFAFDVTEEGYSYRIFLDQDRDGKFDDSEIIQTGMAAVGNNHYNYRLSPSLVGLLQWKIEVYKTDRPGLRYMETGCSAAKNNTGTKKAINVLQIMPADGNYDGKLDLENSELFKKYYKDLADYEVTIKTVTWSEYEHYFENSGFSYDMSKEIGADNPINEDQIDVSANLSGYNMIIVGFGDTYGNVDLSNENGAVDYLKYYIAMGKSILFTHDVTSMYNLQKQNVSKTVFGYTANKSLRDMMGMNRYQAVSNQLTPAERISLIGYQNQMANYDTMYGTAKHGFTYYAMKRLGWSAGEQTVNSQANYRMPYRYLITNTEGNAVCNVSDATRRTGFNDNNDLTTTASKLNEGQITVYPYKIDEELPIAQTHGQWYQLNVEDPEVTVWYCLSDDHDCAGWNEKDQYGKGTALTYGVSPNDAANNYYIYSKGNVFYSGVGHSEVTGDMEAKLFINTMIAAYRASYDPPVVEITNPDAVLSGVQNYSMEFMQEYDNGETAASMENEQVVETFSDTDTVTVTFTTIDFNPVSTKLEGWIYLADGDYIDQITRLSDGAVLTAGADHKFEGLQNGGQYSLVYKKSELNEHRMIKFELKNDRVPTKSTTILNMTVQPLFELD